MLQSIKEYFDYKTEQGFNRLLLLLILFTGSAIRFYRFDEIPFTYDEFSTLFRTGFTNLNELIEQGVKVDFHPAGVQVFANWWESVFGDAEPITKLPYALMGIVSIYFVYAIGRDWMSPRVGLYASAFVAVAQYSVMYSIVARMYAPAFLFSLLFFYFFLQLRKHDKYLWFYTIGAMLAAAGCAYTHYIALLTALLMGGTALFFLPKEKLKYWLTAAIGAFVLYLPHLDLTFYHLGKGGVGGESGWLAKPELRFFVDYLGYIFHYSWLLFISVIALVVWNFTPNSAQRKIRNASLFLFLAPLVICYTYSVLKNPLLQFSVLLFSFPFFLYFIFSWSSKGFNPYKQFFSSISILLVGILTLQLNRHHFTDFYESPYLSVLQEGKQYQELSNTKDTLGFVYSDERINGYYQKNHPDLKFPFISVKNTNQKDWLKFIAQRSKTTSSIYYGYEASAPPVLENMIRSYFPSYQIKKEYFGGNALVFKKGDDKRKIIASSIGVNKSLFSSDVWDIKPTDATSPVLEIPLPYYIHPMDFIDVVIDIPTASNLDDVVLVASIEGIDTTYAWYGQNLGEQQLDTLRGQKFFHSVKLSDVKFPRSVDTKLKVYVWNNGHKDFIINKLNIYHRQGNRKVYGIYYNF